VQADAGVDAKGGGRGWAGRLWSRGFALAGEQNCQTDQRPVEDQAAPSSRLELVSSKIDRATGSSEGGLIGQPFPIVFASERVKMRHIGNRGTDDNRQVLMTLLGMQTREGAFGFG
jgi:hypothetical protein